MSIITDKHGSPLRSVHSARKNYVLTQDELEALMRATHQARSDMEAKIETRKVWKSIAKKYDIDLESIGKPVGTDHPRTFSALPNEPNQSTDKNTNGNSDQENKAGMEDHEGEQE